MTLEFVLPDSIQVPFTSLDFWQGKEAQGFLRADAQKLTLEFQVVQYDDSLWPTVIDRSDVMYAEIPFNDIESVQLKGWLEAVIEVQTKTLAPLSKVPGSKQGLVKLSITDKNRAQAKELVSVVQVRLSELALAKARPRIEQSE